MVNAAGVGVVLLAMSGGAPVQDTSLAALQTGLAESISYVGGQEPTISYCPDNTCELFRGTRGTTRADLADFALLYLWRASDYEYLNSWRRSPEPMAVREALARQREHCASPQRGDMLRCTLHALATHGGVAVFFVRDDEGHRTEERQDLAKTLSRLK
jgi:hypothetical protein